MGSKSSQIPFKRKGYANLLNDNLSKKIKYAMIGMQPTGAVISCSLAIALRKSFVKTNNSTMLIENEGLGRQERLGYRSNFLKRKN